MYRWKASLSNTASLYYVTAILFASLFRRHKPLFHFSKSIFPFGRKFIGTFVTIESIEIKRDSVTGRCTSYGLSINDGNLRNYSKNPLEFEHVL